MQEYVDLVRVACRKLADAQEKDKDFNASEYIFVLGKNWEKLTWNDMIPNRGGIAFLLGIRVVWNEFDKKCIDLYRKVE